MDTKQAQQLIQQVFTQPFELERYQKFVLNLLNHYEERSGHSTGNYIPDAFRQHINQYWRIGKYGDPDGNQLDLLVVEVKTLDKLERARSSLRNFAVNRLKRFGKEASLIAFYAQDDKGADWRFSFVKIEHEAYKDEEGKVKLKQELTPARRYSYLVGEHENSHTACKQLLPILEMDYANPRVEEIEAAFSIEKVTDEFFDQYKALFHKLAEHLKKQPFKQADHEETDQAVSRFAKKLLGQIVFLYFLQKKGWLGAEKDQAWGEGTRRFLRERYQQAEEKGQNYYRDFLQYLFYEALACKREEQDDPGYYERFQCRVPFLNGGLFEADYDWQQVSIEIPNRLFHNDEKTDAGDVGTGILDVFDRYNFTIKEDEPLEKEVAVDPEMLGKVFENMLEITERKSKGAFYTPREIVHYMCQESLIHYLDNRLNTYATHYEELGSPQTSLFGNASRKGQLSFMVEHQDIQVPRKDLETLIRKGHLTLENDTRVLSKGEETGTYQFQLPEAVRNHAKAIDTALADIKVCDPAIGSGAFPVGLLHEIVGARQALAPHSGNTQSAYDLKLHAIAESIYGVDIDASAIDIARLRLWLSLIVDEENYDTIAALPNLDYKIVWGNSLIGFPENWTSRAFEQIEALKEQFFAETDHDEKARLKAEIDAGIEKRKEGSKAAFGYQVDFDFRLMFSEVWHHKGGFDVVIGNPPYVQIQKFSGQQVQKDWEAQRYESFVRTGDIYCLFYEKGYQLLKDKGVLAFITSNKWMRAAYGKKLRRFFLSTVDIKQLIDFGDSPIFSEATTYTNILLFEKGKQVNSPIVWDLSSAYRKATSLERMLDENPAGAALFNEESFVIASAALAAIKRRIAEVGTPLKDWDIVIYRGVLTGFNKAFIIDGKKKNELIAVDPKSAEIIKPILRGRDIKRYRIDFADLWLIATFPALNLNIDDYPAVRDYLKSFGRKLYQTGEVIGKDENGTVLKSRKKTGNKWFETQDQISYFEEFAKEKIVWLEMSPKPNFAFSTNEDFVLNTSYILTGNDLKWLLAILNAEIMDCYFSLVATDVRGKTRRYIKQYVELLPISPRRESYTCSIEPLVDYVELSKAQDYKLQSAYFEQVIDALVYELYFPDELKAAGKDILRHLGTLTPISDGMGNAEQLATIQREFDRLYDPRHPVRNIIETLDSVEVVRTIREALQRK
ncbi:MAG: Eco57I restriction-modification methylase domain-containing protein [Desulfobulbus sp.]|jgi:type I restriction-modification system DNA methylase subunit